MLGGMEDGNVGEDERGIDEVEEADRALEDAATAGDPASLSGPEDAPEADALEQRRELRPHADERPSPSAERPEADAAEQARGIDADEDEEERH